MKLLSKRTASILLVLIFIGLVFVFLNSYRFISRYIEGESKVDIKNQIGLDKYKAHEIVNCKFGIFRSDYAFVSDAREIDSDNSNLEIAFFSANRSNPFISNWNIIGTGGTTIKNATFPELLKMVKENCSQFQKGYLDYTGYENLSDREKQERYREIDERNLGWTYTPNKPKTEEDLQRERIQKIKDNQLSNMTEEELEAQRQLELEWTM